MSIVCSNDISPPWEIFPWRLPFRLGSPDGDALFHVESRLSNRPHTLPLGSLILLDDQIPGAAGTAWKSGVPGGRRYAVAHRGRRSAFGPERAAHRGNPGVWPGYLAQCCREAGCSIGMPPAFPTRRRPPCFSPRPCHRPPQTVLEPYRGREIWLRPYPPLPDLPERRPRLCDTGAGRGS